jgi:hypothetical protein
MLQHSNLTSGPSLFRRVSTYPQLEILGETPNNNNNDDGGGDDYDDDGFRAQSTVTASKMASDEATSHHSYPHIIPSPFEFRLDLDLVISF